MSRVLQLVSRDEPGGVQVLATMIADGLTRRDHQVTTLALADGVGTVTRAALRGHYDAIFSYQVAAGILGSVLGRMGGVRRRVTHLTAIPGAMRGHWRWLDRQAGLWGLHSEIIASSGTTLASVAAYPPPYRHRLLRIDHGVAPLPAPAAIDWRARLGIPCGHRLLSASGRLAPQKNHAVAVAALADLPQAHLVIAGEGELRAQLVQQAESFGVGSRFHLTGNLGRPELAALLGQSDVLLFPSVWESFGLAAVEAAMLGVPVIASDLPVLRAVLGAAEPGMARFHAADCRTSLGGAVQACLAAYPAELTRQISAQKIAAAHSVEAMIDAYCRLLARA